MSSAKTSILTDIFMFISSYFPLFLILAIKDLKLNKNGSFIETDLSISGFFSHWSNPYLSLGLLFISLMSLVALFIFKHFIFSGRYSEQKIYLKSIDIVKSDMINYTIPFLVGLIGLDYSTIINKMVLFVFLFFMFFILKKQGVLFFNPMLLMLNVGHAKITYEIVGAKGDVFSCDVIGDRSSLESKLTLHNSVATITKISGVSILQDK